MEPADGNAVLPPTGMNGDLANYEHYRDRWRDIARRIEASMSMPDGSDCVSCQTRSTIKIHLWENPLD
jgi:hypothetical protein